MKLKCMYAVLLAALLLIPAACDTGRDVIGQVIDITLPDLDGREVSLSGYKGRVVLLNFFATWCPPCREEIPDLIQLQNELGPKGLTVAAISLDTTPPAEVREFADGMKMNYQVLYAGKKSDEVVAAVGGFQGIPTTCLLDREGRLVKRITGLASKAELVRELEKLL